MNSIKDMAIRKLFIFGSSSPSWVGIGQLSCRVLVAAKFFMVSVMLGPDAIGLASIGLLSLAVIDCLCETGLQQAYTQYKFKVSPGMESAIWLIQLMRGGVICIILIAISVPMERFLNAEGVSKIILLTSLCPIIKNSKSLGMIREYKKCNFKAIAIIDVVSSVVDLVTTYIVSHFGVGPESLVIGNIFAEAVRLILSWVLYPVNALVKAEWNAIKLINNYGKWIWGNSVVNVFCNQYDKIVIAKFLGTVSLGNVQMALKITQLMYVDAALMIAMYIFPKISQINRDGLSDRFVVGSGLKLLAIFSIFSTAVAAFSFIGFSKLIPTAWKSAAELLFLFIPFQIFNSLAVVLSAQIRARGRPEVVTKIVIFQTLLIVCFVTPLCINFGVLGALIGNTIISCVVLGMLIIFLMKKSYNS